MLQCSEVEVNRPCFEQARERDTYAVLGVLISCDHFRRSENVSGDSTTSNSAIRDVERVEMRGKLESRCTLCRD